MLETEIVTLDKTFVKIETGVEIYISIAKAKTVVIQPKEVPGTAIVGDVEDNIALVTSHTPEMTVQKLELAVSSDEAIASFNEKNKKWKNAEHKVNKVQHLKETKESHHVFEEQDPNLPKGWKTYVTKWHSGT